MTGTGKAEESKAETNMGEEAERKKWGTHVMGAPAKPTAHPDNQKAALWKAEEQQRQYYHDQPYLVYSPLEKPPSNNPLEPVIHAFTTWSHKAETLARNIWHNCTYHMSIYSIVSLKNRLKLMNHIS